MRERSRLFLDARNEFRREQMGRAGLAVEGREDGAWCSKSKILASPFYPSRGRGLGLLRRLASTTVGGPASAIRLWSPSTPGG